MFCRRRKRRLRRESLFSFDVSRRAAPCARARRPFGDHHPAISEERRRATCFEDVGLRCLRSAQVAKIVLPRR